MRVNDFSVLLHHTDVVNIDEDAHALPPSNGLFEEYKVADYFCPKNWSKDGFFVRVEEEMPLWIDFRFNRKCAVIPSVQRLNPLTGKPADLEHGLAKDPEQNYMILPDQKWLDGYAKEGKVYQFMITKAGESLAVNEFLLPKHLQDSHALGFAFFEPVNPPEPKINIDWKTYHYYNKPSWWWPHEYWNTHISSNPYRYYSTYWSNVTTKTLDGTISAQSLSDSKIMRSAYGGQMLGGGFAADDEDCASVETFCKCGDSKSPTYNILDQEEMEEPEESFDKASMGAGGRIEQEVLTDNNTVEYYKEKSSAMIVVYLALPQQFDAIMKKGKRQDASRKDKYVHSGEIGGIQIPLTKKSS